MQKYFYLLALFFFFFPKGYAYSNPYKMTHERFTYLSQEDKNTLIIRTMEIMIEMESKYAKEVKTSGYNEERFQKYVHMINRLKSLLISEAVAADFGTMSSDFIALFASKKSKSCIYGGWVSEIVTYRGVKYCTHPSKAKDPKIKNAYLNPKGKCISPSNMTCNPMVFGYKKSDTEEPFCVETGFTTDHKNKAHNVSYECMRAALKNPVNPKDQDTKEKRLLYMSEAMKAQPKAFDAVHSYIFQTCACGKSEMDQDYLEYIRPHRTCFGMMNSLRAFSANDCVQMIATIPPANTEFMKKWNNFFNDTNINSLSVPSSRLPVKFDNDYKEIMDDPAIKQYCDGGPTPIPDDQPKPDDQPTPEDKKEWFCETLCEDGAVDANGSKKYNCKVTKAGWKVNGKEEPIDISKLKIKEVKDILAGTTTISIQLEDDSKQNCPIVIKETPKEEEEKSCSIAVSAGADKTKALATLSFNGIKDEDVSEFKWSDNAEANSKKSKEAIYIKGKDKKSISVSVTLKADPSKPITCPAEIPGEDPEEKPKDPKYDIKATAETAKETTVKVNAEVKIDDVVKTNSLPAGFKISWSRKGSGVSKLKVADKKETKSKGVGDGADGEVVPTSSTAIVTEGEVGTGPTITEVRVEEDYQACASLISDKGEVKAGPSCATIPKVTPVQNPNQNNNQNPNNMPPPPVFQLTPYNTSTPGML
jgi:hypothetical protein